jgi:hypothetical protein
MIFSGLIALAIWNYGPAWLHPYMQALGVLAVLAAIVMTVRYIIEGRRELANMPSRSEYRWPEGWDVGRFHRALLTYLKIHDWRITAAEAPDADHLLLCVQRDRHRVTMLLLRPGLTPDADDVSFLRAMQHRDGTWEAALISEASTRQEPQIDEHGARLLMLDYEALTALTDTLDGGSEEERWARAEAARKQAKPARSVQA